MRNQALAVLIGLFVVADPSAAPSAHTASVVSPGQPVPVMFRFSSAAAPDGVRQLANQVLGSQDNEHRPFIIIDKRSARIFVIDARGALMGQAPVLLGAALGDDSVPGIGERPIAEIQTFERTTPAGRFVAQAGRNIKGEDIVWVDYDAAVSMHRVRAANASERRLERLASETAADNRISYGCINIPVEFYNQMIAPLFVKGPHVVYILPEVKTPRAVFG